ncbi:MAG: hypothetical protein KDC05_06445 [Bacteroidales bacterium]|nr:hypothetical protein [Bacteroidales bacterium]
MSKKAGLFFPIVVASLIILPIWVFAQSKYQKNPHVRYEVSENEDNWTIKYTFSDIFSTLQTYNLTLPKTTTGEMIDRFGIPTWMFEPYSDTEANRIERMKILQSGLFVLNDNTIEVDKSAVLAYYSETFCKPIAEMLISSLRDYGKDSRLNRIEIAMRFVQDIPYGIPTYEKKGRHFGGVSPPPKLLIEGYGDCDSKVLLFAGILMYLIPGDDIIFLNQSRHVLSAIKGEPDSYDTFIRFDGDKYLIAETAGPGKRRLGEKGNYFRNQFKPERLHLDLPDPIPIDSLQHAKAQRFANDNIDHSSLIITNQSNREFRFQLSLDQQQWQPYNIAGNNSGKIEFGQKINIYIRFRDARMDYQIYQVETGNSYIINFSKRKKEFTILQVNEQATF